MLIGIQKLLLQTTFWMLAFVRSKKHAFFIVIGFRAEKNNLESSEKKSNQKLLLQNFSCGFKPEVSFAINLLKNFSKSCNLFPVEFR